MTQQSNRLFYQEDHFIERMIHLIIKCNKQILEVYDEYRNEEQSNMVQYKKDDSPVTKADILTNDIIMRDLNVINEELRMKWEKEHTESNIESHPTTIGIISEEVKNEPYEERSHYDYCWLVDPLDGTKEFIKKNGQFTTNIGLCYKGVPVFGIVSVPTSGDIYYGGEGLGSFKLNAKDVNNDSRVKGDYMTKLQVDENKDLNRKGVAVVASASHMNEDTKAFMKGLNDPRVVNVGSSIKLLWVAEGKADVYPRVAPTCEWDTCAAHAVVKYAGGKVLNFHTGQELSYNKENVLNPYFIVS